MSANPEPSSDPQRAKATLGPLFGNLFRGASTAESSNQKDSGAGSNRVVKSQFNRLLEDTGPGVVPEGAWTNPDLAAGHELVVIDKAPMKPLHSVNSTSRIEDQHDLTSSTRRADYE